MVSPLAYVNERKYKTDINVHRGKISGSTQQKVEKLGLADNNVYLRFKLFLLCCIERKIISIFNMGEFWICYYRLFIYIYKQFSDTTPSFDASNDRGALSTNVLTAAEFCFLSAEQGDVKQATYSTNMTSETSFRLQKDLSYGVLTICTCQSYQTRFYTDMDANLYRGANPWC